MEEVNHVLRRVTTRGEDLRPAHVRLRLEVAAVLQKQCIETNAADRIEDLRRIPADLSAEDSAEDAEAGLGGVGF